MAHDRASEPGGASLQVSAARAGLDEDRRIVTVVFADVVGSTALAERLDAEEMRAILGSILRTLAERVDRYGGTVDKYVGDAVMAVFGAPEAHEDDATLALHCALDMRTAMLELAHGVLERHAAPLALRIGVNTGEVVAGALASDVQAAYTVVGDAVNTAQRLQSAARPGEILVGSLTRRQAADLFHFEDVEPVRVRGKERAIEAHRLVAAAGAAMLARRATTRPIASALVG
ncbi:MAG: adenylate/guanylate cyclase domain-containing protein, partial [Candidatus Limnocylindria bacterium]